jgi:hypothetical protein
MGLTQPSEATVIFWTADLRVTASARIVLVMIRASRHWSWQVPTRRWVAPRRVGTICYSDGQCFNRSRTNSRCFSNALRLSSSAWSIDSAISEG